MKSAMIEIARKGRRLRAREDIDRVEQMRLVAAGLDKRLSQEDVARALQISQPTVSRIARKIKAGFDPAEVRPSEVINRHLAGEIDEAEMMDRLAALDFTAGQYDPTGGDGYLDGTWDEVQSAARQGLLSVEQYDRLVTRARFVDG